MNAKELKPCPKCGGKAELYNYDGECYYVCCSKCMVHTFLVYKAINALDEWQNRRVIDRWIKKTGERAVIESFEGKESYEETLRESDYYLSMKSPLMLEAGCA